MHTAHTNQAHASAGCRTRYPKVSHGIARYPTASQGIPRYRKVSHGIARYRKVSQRIPPMQHTCHGCPQAGCVPLVHRAQGWGGWGRLKSSGGSPRWVPSAASPQASAPGSWGVWGADRRRLRARLRARLRDPEDGCLRPLCRLRCLRFLRVCRCLRVCRFLRVCHLLPASEQLPLRLPPPAGYQDLRRPACVG